jgi:membrane protease YdiL (CAAX protease family)
VLGCALVSDLCFFLSARGLISLGAQKSQLLAGVLRIFVCIFLHSVGGSLSGPESSPMLFSHSSVTSEFGMGLVVLLLGLNVVFALVLRQVSLKLLAQRALDTYRWSRLLQEGASHVLLIPILEELFYRQLLLGSLLNEHIWWPIAIALQAVWFASNHQDGRILRFLRASSYGVAFFFCGSVLHSIILHVLNNLLAWLLDHASAPGKADSAIFCSSCSKAQRVGSIYFECLTCGVPVRLCIACSSTHKTSHILQPDEVYAAPENIIATSVAGTHVRTCIADSLQPPLSARSSLFQSASASGFP